MQQYKKIERTFELIIGIHSIGEALRNRARNHRRLVGTVASLKELKKYLGSDELIDRNIVEEVSAHELQEQAKQKFKELNFEFQRIPTNLYLETSLTPFYGPELIYEDLLKKDCRIFCLDQVTDMHNSAAIIRSLAFFGVDYLVTSQKGSFGLSPKFFRIASGGVEHIKMVRCSSLPKFLKKLKKLGVTVIGFSEHAKSDAVEVSGSQNKCLVMGAEDVGLSNAVERSIDHLVAFRPIGNIQSLNVSVASALAMQMIFKR